MDAADADADAGTPPGGLSLIERAARAMGQEPHGLGSLLAQRCAAHGWDADQLAGWLGMDRAWLPVLALCRRLDPTDPHAADRIADLASFTGCDPDRLADLLGGT